MRPSAGEITQLLKQWRTGEPAVRDDLLHRLYHELTNVARSQLARERPDHTLQPEALIHETYLKMGGANDIEFTDRNHFIAITARMMRQVLVDHGRMRNARRRNSSMMMTVSPELEGSQTQMLDLYSLDQALRRLESINSQYAKIVELRYFGGLTIAETAEVTGQSTATVNRSWRVARAWLFKALQVESEA